MEVSGGGERGGGAAVGAGGGRVGWGSVQRMRSEGSNAPSRGVGVWRQITTACLNAERG